MINDVSRYLSYSRENFSNIVLSVPSNNGISILTRADKRLSRTYPAPRARIHERSRQFPKRGEALRIKNGRSSRMKWQKMATGRAANSNWQKTKSKKKRAKKRSRRGGGRERRRGRGRTATQGVHRGERR